MAYKCRDHLQNSRSGEGTADGGQTDLGKEIGALSSLSVNLLKSQGFITVPAGEQGEEITQTPGDMTELMQNPYEQGQRAALGKSSKKSWKTTRRKTALMTVLGLPGTGSPASLHRF